MEQVIRIRLDELEAFVGSRLFHSLDVKPISLQRALSYMHNPNGKPEDVVLYMVTKGETLAAFRTVWAGKLKNDNRELRFGWCSGSWVAPAYRGKGMSVMLLREAYADWQTRLMFTNYSPGGQSANLSSGLFVPLYTHKGIRAYFPSAYPAILAKRGTGWFLLPIAKVLASLLGSFWKLIGSYSSPVNPVGYTFEVLDMPDKECLEIADSISETTFFGRGSADLEWIFRYPWVTPDPLVPDFSYPFSSYSGEFSLKVVKIKENSVTSGFFIFSEREGHLKSHHFYLSSRDFLAAAFWIRAYCGKNQPDFVTILHPEISREVRKHWFPFFYVKGYGQTIYSTFHMSQSADQAIQDGDGDYIFT